MPIHLTLRFGWTSAALIASVVLISTVATRCADDAGTQAQGITDVTNEDRGLWAVASIDSDAPWLPVLASRDLAVGVQRLAFSLAARSSAPPFDAASPPSVRAAVYQLDESATEPRAVRFAVYLPVAPSSFTAHAHAGATVSDNAEPIAGGLYVVPVTLDRTGDWGIEFTISDGDVSDTVRFRFSVRERPAAPGVGDAAISVATPTAADGDAIAAISSDPDPEPGLYARSLDEALAAGAPILLAFATPAYCHSRTCAPVLDAVKQVWREHAGRLAGIHVEVFRNPRNPERLEEAEAFAAWRLPSEPWVFLIDREGRIAAAWEGPVAHEELTEAVQSLIGG